MDTTLKIALIGLIGGFIGALVRLLGDVYRKGVSRFILFALGLIITGLSAAVILVILQPSTTPGPDTNLLAGNWAGTISSPDGSFSTPLQLSFGPSCKLNEVCGTYDAYQLPCAGTLTLVRVDGQSFVFAEKRTSGASSCLLCYEYIEELSENSISYGCSTTGLSRDFRSTGVLSKQ